MKALHKWISFFTLPILMFLSGIPGVARSQEDLNDIFDRALSGFYGLAEKAALVGGAILVMWGLWKLKGSEQRGPNDSKGAAIVMMVIGAFLMGVHAFLPALTAFFLESADAPDFTP